MALVELNHYYPSIDQADEYDLTNFEVIARGDEKVGTVASILVNEDNNRIHYLVVDTGLLWFGKKLLLPIGLVEIVYMDRRVYVESLTKEQVKALPEYTNGQPTSSNHEDNHEEQIRQLLSSLADPKGGQPENPAAYDFELSSDLYAVKDDRLKLLQDQLSREH